MPQAEKNCMVLVDREEKLVVVALREYCTTVEEAIEDG